MPLTLSAAYVAHRGRVSDKWASYLLRYDNIFSKFRYSPIKLLEIGVQNGGSLEIWSRYFPKAKRLVGCDINPKCGDLVFDDQRISVVVGDAASPDTTKLLAGMGPFDIIIDDGSHTSPDIIASLGLLFREVAPGGLYVIEDLHASYWDAFKGGLGRPTAAMERLKDLVDIPNHEHWASSPDEPTHIEEIANSFGVDWEESKLGQISEVRFYNSLAIIRRKKDKDELLGERVVAGSVAQVDPEALLLHNNAAGIITYGEASAVVEAAVRDNFVPEPLPALLGESQQEELIRLREQYSTTIKSLLEDLENQRDAYSELTRSWMFFAFRALRWAKRRAKGALRRLRRLIIQLARTALGRRRIEQHNDLGRFPVFDTSKFAQTTHHASLPKQVGSFSPNLEARELEPYSDAELLLISTNDIVTDFSLIFFTYRQKNRARVRISLAVYTGDDFVTLVEEDFSGDAVQDGQRLAVSLKHPIVNSQGRLLRIRVSVQATSTDSRLAIATAPSHFYGATVLDGRRLASNLAVDFNSAIPCTSRGYFAFVSGCPGDAYRYRCVHQAEALRFGGYFVDVFPANEFPWRRLAENYQVVILHRVPSDANFFEFTELCKAMGVRLIFDTDDLVFDETKVEQIDAYRRMTAPEKHLFLQGVRRYHAAMAEVDAITVTTEALAAEATARFPGKPVAITRNVVSEAMQSLADHASGTPAEDSIVLAYFSGSKTHQQDFEECATAVARILKDNPQVRLLIVGHLLLSSALDHVRSQIRYLPFMSWQSLPEVYAGVDINLAPLERNNVFTEGKSELKFLEAALLGVPTVASKLGAFEAVLRHGETGLLCRTEQEWYEALETLIHNEDARLKIGANARSYVLANGTTRSRAIEHQRCLVSLAPTEATARPSVSFVLRAPIANTGGGYKKIFILANGLLSEGFDVRVYVEPIAHLEGRSEDYIRQFVTKHFQFPGKRVFVGHDHIGGDIVVATNWPTAPTVATSRDAKIGLYFVQDFEAEFYEFESPDYIAAARTYFLNLGMVCIGSYLARRLASFSGRPTLHIPFAIDDAFLKVERRQEERPIRIAFFARPNIPRRRFDLGVAALAEIAATYPDVVISLYGLEAAVDLPFRYENWGVLSQSELALKLSSADIHLSFSMTNISTVIYEAMAAGCACIEADVPPVRAMVDSETTCILTAPNLDDVVNALRRLIDDPQLMGSIASAGLKSARGLTNEAMIASFRDILLQKWNGGFGSVRAA